MISIVHDLCSIQDNQELLWEKIIEILKDCLSPEILEKYGKVCVKQETLPTTAIPLAEESPVKVNPKSPLDDSKLATDNPKSKHELTSEPRAHAHIHRANH